MTVDSLHEVKAASLKGLKMLDIKATELKIIKTFEGYHLARHNGNLGIWGIFKADGFENAYLLDDDCNHLLEPEWYGLFESRVLDLKAEARYLASLEA